METRGLRPARKQKKAPCLVQDEAGGLEKKTGGALLSHAPGRSTIAAGALNVRVREGNGCDSPAKATGQKSAAGSEGTNESKDSQKGRRGAPGRRVAQ